MDKYADPGIDGWMTPEELAWLHDTARGMASIAEIGSWKGRSTHALLTGCPGTVTAIDHFAGGTVEQYEVPAGLFETFRANVGHFPHLEVVRHSSAEAAALLAGRTFEMVFIDGSHDYESVKADIALWRPMATRILCGHDYCSGWPGVRRAVDDALGKPDEVHGTIWVHRVGAGGVKGAW